MEFLPERISKAQFYKIYLQNYNMSCKDSRARLNYYIKTLGGNINCRRVPEAAMLLFIKSMGLPRNFQLSDHLQKKLDRIK